MKTESGVRMMRVAQIEWGFESYLTFGDISCFPNSLSSFFRHELIYIYICTVTFKI